MENFAQYLPAIGVFIVSFAGLTFFENFIGVKGLVKIIISIGIAYLFYNYWYLVMEKIEFILETLGLPSLK